MQTVRADRGLPRGLCCHPYDLSTALVAEESGVILTDAVGAPCGSPASMRHDAIRAMAFSSSSTSSRAVRTIVGE